jgi:putative endonuclease
MNNIELGKTGEKAAEHFLQKLGYKIIEKNYTTFMGEIDIIAQDKNQIVFVEVKSRTDGNFALPKEAVDSYKQSRYSLLAMQYIKNNNLFNVRCRIDVIEVTGENLDKINHIKNAFGYIKSRRQR